MHASRVLRASQPILGRKWPTPILKPLYPFFIAGGFVFYGIWNIQASLLTTDQWKNDPRNPNLRSGNAH